MRQSFICQGRCSLVYEIDETEPPKQVTSFEGTAKEAEKSGWKFTNDSKWSKNGEVVVLCPECAKEE